MQVVGTAGHVDHGKSTLVHALTGIDPDRLAEEKARGMTIDLGFAWLTLPSGRQVSIVDVPGHERFIKNMLAGVGGIDLALLVVAVDEGIMPQTREHLDILELLAIDRVVVAMTKADAVDDEWLELVMDETANALSDTSLARAPLQPVSALTGAGIPDLLRLLDLAVDSIPPHTERRTPRLPVDRVFSLAGHGTVVTGTLLDGILSVGQEVEVQPSGRLARIRSLQTHRQRVQEAMPGTRVAVNLVGLSTDEVVRGDVVTLPGWLTPSRTLDVRLQLLKSANQELRHDDEVALYVGAAEVTAKVRPLDRDRLEPGDRGLVQLRLDAPVAVRRHDRYIIRRPSPSATIGGGEVLDAVAKHHRRYQNQVLHALAVAEAGSGSDVVGELLRSRRVWDVNDLAARSQITVHQLDGQLSELKHRGDLVHQFGAWVSSAESWDHIKVRVVSTLGEYHRTFPLRSGMPREELRSQLNLPARPWTDMVAGLERDGVVEQRGAVVSLAGFAPTLDARQQAAVGALLAALEEQPYSPPSLDEIVGGRDLELEAFLIEQGTLFRLSDQVALTGGAYWRMRERVLAVLQDQGKITVAEVRDLFSTSRRYALAFLEHLDAERVTRRVGDERVLVHRTPPDGR